MELDLDVVVEVHNESELEVALTVDADVIGINNRNLDDFTVDVQTTFELMPDVPAGKTVVSESGIADRHTLEELERVGSGRRPDRRGADAGRRPRGQAQGAHRGRGIDPRAPAPLNH